MARHSRAQGVFKHRIPDGKWLLISERRTRDGGIVAILTDITDQYHLEQELIRQATTDGLTGVANRRHFFERANTEVARARREGAPLSVLQMDVDHFKQINDCHGHAVGDHTLRKLANGCRQELRETDILARVGGEEFAVALPKSSEAQSVGVAERLRTHLMSLEIPTKQDILRFTVSIGVAECQVHHESVEEALSRADQALYQAKHRGRNRVVAYTELMEAVDN